MWFEMDIARILEIQKEGSWARIGERKEMAYQQASLAVARVDI